MLYNSKKNFGIQLNVFFKILLLVLRCYWFLMNEQVLFLFNGHKYLWHLTQNIINFKTFSTLHHIQ
jgi:hypothetical protein